MNTFIISGICFILYGLQVVYNGINNGFYVSVFQNFGSNYYQIFVILGHLFMITTGILTIINKPRKTIGIAMLAAAISKICVIIVLQIMYMTVWKLGSSLAFELFKSNLWSVLSSCGYVLAAVMSMRETPLRKVWFLPALLSLSSMLSTVVFSEGSLNISYIFAFLGSVGLALYCYGLSKEEITVPARTSPSPVVQTHGGSYSDAEELKRYYSLYQEGILTEEEYKTKREEILKR